MRHGQSKFRTVLIAWSTWNIMGGGLSALFSYFASEPPYMPAGLLLLSMMSAFWLSAIVYIVCNQLMRFGLDEDRSINFTLLIMLMAGIIIIHIYPSYMKWWLILGYVGGTILTIGLRSLQPHKEEWYEEE